MNYFFKALGPVRLPLVILFIWSCRVPAFGQGLLDELEQSEPEQKTFTYASFKGTRAVNGHSVETKRKGELEFIISHRFGRLNSGSYNFWGLDDAFIRLGLEYGITDRLGVGIGRNSFNKIYDGYLKYKFLKQSSGPGSVPVTITGFTSLGIQSFPKKDDDPTIEFGDRINYTYQLLIARKFSPKFTFQVAPTLLHANLVNSDISQNDLIAVGLAGRYKLTQSLAINGEYYIRANAKSASPYHNSLGIGIDIETGGHVFQLIMSNTQGMVERTFIRETAGEFFEGDIHFGFNITRTFQLGNK